MTEFARENFGNAVDPGLDTEVCAVAEEKPSTPDARAALGVTAAATRAQVVTAFRRQARKVHPDVSHAGDASDRFAALVAAYRVAFRAAGTEPDVSTDLGTGPRSEASADPAAVRFQHMMRDLAGTLIYESGRPVMLVGPARVDGPSVRPGGTARQGRAT
jgi:hypothetical protein